MIKPFSGKKIAYSFGINDDVAWDLQMANEGYELYQFDHTINKLPQKNASFHWYKLGLTGGAETDCKKNIETILALNGHLGTQNLLLKMDIEGDEWAVFANCSQQILEQFDQITVEFHGLEEYNRDLVITALENLSKTHAVIHIHINNHCRQLYCGNLVLPQTIEVTYIKKGLYDLKKCASILPEYLDTANNRLLPDFWLGEWNIPHCSF